MARCPVQWLVCMIKTGVLNTPGFITKSFSANDILPLASAFWLPTALLTVTNTCCDHNPDINNVGRGGGRLKKVNASLIGSVVIFKIYKCMTWHN